MRRMIAVALTFLGMSAIAWAQDDYGGQLGITLPGEPWTLGFDMKDFKQLKANRLEADGRWHMLAENRKAKLTLTVYLERVEGKATAAGCKEIQNRHSEENLDDKRENLRTREVNGMVIMEFTIAGAGRTMPQRNVFACIPKDDVYVDIHLTKILHRPDDDQVLADILNSATFIPMASRPRQ
jgi:hypothetical protein